MGKLGYIYTMGYYSVLIKDPAICENMDETGKCYIK
jgi:hypothetical protein